MDFHVLYEQICLSEQKAQERQSLLTEVKNEISKVQQEIRETKESGLFLKSQLAQKLKSLASEEENEMWYSRRQEMLQEKLDSMRKQMSTHHDQLVATQESSKQERSKFMSDIAAFTNSYDLGGKGQKQRQAEAKKNLDALQHQQKQLETDIEILGKQQAAITKEEEKKIKLQREIQQRKSKLKSLKDNHDQQKLKTRRLETAKTQVANIPNTDPEFQRLRAEHESCQDDTMQGVCQALQQELDRLQRQRWQQQVQRRPLQPTQQAPPQTKVTSLMRPYQSSNRAPVTEHQPYRVNAPSTSTSVPPSAGVKQSDEKSTATAGASKFKPNLAKLRRSMEQQQSSNTQQAQQASTPSTSNNSAPPPAKQMKKVRFENKW